MAEANAHGLDPERAHGGGEVVEEVERLESVMMARDPEVLGALLRACEHVIKRDPCGGNLKSGRW